MLTMSQQTTIRELWQDGKDKSEISAVLHIDRKNVTKYLEKKDFSDKLEHYEIKKKNSKPYGMSENPTNVSLSGFDALLGKETGDEIC